MQLTRRHRAKALGIALLLSGVFTLFITRVFLEDAPDIPLRSCGASKLFQGLSLQEKSTSYHSTIDRLVEERMKLYKGQTVLQCQEKSLAKMIPAGDFLTKVVLAMQDAHEDLGLPKNKEDVLYAHFVHVLYELWRVYDCDLKALGADPPKLAIGTPPPEGEERIFSRTGIEQSSLTDERARAMLSHERLLSLLRPSEEYLPVHAGVRCTQRMAHTIRAGAAGIADASQCLITVGGETSLLK